MTSGAERPSAGFGARDRLSDLFHTQLPRTRRTLLLSMILADSGAMAAWGVSTLAGVPPSWLTRDLADITQRGSYLGLLSNLGIMGWMGAASFCLGGARLLRAADAPVLRRRFLTSAALLSFALCLDDTFMFHERLAPKLLIPEVVVLLAYVMAIGAFLVVFRSLLAETDHLILGLSLTSLGLSAGLDQVLPFSESLAFWEDIPKFLGIILWLAYFSRTALEMTRKALLPAVGRF